MKYQQSSKREEKSKFITNQLTNMAHIPIQSYLYLLLGTTLFSCAPQELKTPFELKCENIPVPVGRYSNSQALLETSAARGR